MPSSSQSPPAKQRFFKVMMPGFQTKLSLPPAFCMKLKEVPEQAFLTSCKGTWMAEVVQYGKYKIRLEKGWDNFVESHDLKIGEFVFFKQIAHLHFKARIHDSTTFRKRFPEKDEESSGLNGSNGSDVAEHTEEVKRGRGRPRKRAASPLQKEFPAHATQKRGRPRKKPRSKQEFPMEINEEKESSENISDEYVVRRGRPSNATVATRPIPRHFTQPINASNIDNHSPGVYLPKDFCKAHCISVKTRISLKDPLGEVHEAKLSQHSNDRLWIKTGWVEFCKSNKIKKGDSCFFRIASEDTRAGSANIMMDVKVYKKCS